MSTATTATCSSCRSPGPPPSAEETADELLTGLAEALGRVDRAALVRDLSRRAAETRGSR
ncbi:hypothetical protein O3Q52_04970 [Streptomyces sp. ActVer]|uniref:hypothetical protein n=1 Tax=Streptomyces sp. ActVer TaxID=3014558 RepID=UPI0022B4C50B|nr:hypothetical protein [Streptomyces sp. ActVer]MCZ4507571.1 hypothetical protein [Streptomyces sp. ActVer]